MKKLLAGLLAMCLLLALSACGLADQSEANQTGTYPEGMVDIIYTEPEPEIDFGEKDFIGDANFEDFPANSDPMEDI